MKMKLKNLTNKISKSKIKVVGLKEASGFTLFQRLIGQVSLVVNKYNLQIPLASFRFINLSPLLGKNVKTKL